MTGSPDNAMSLIDFLKTEEPPTGPLPPIPAPSPRVKKLQARVENLQLSPSTLDQIKDRTPGTPSSLHRSVSIQKLGERAESVTSPTGTFDDRDPETPSSYAEFLRADEQKAEDAQCSGYSLQEFLQEDKQKENDELIDGFLAKVFEPIREPRSSLKTPSRSRRPRVAKIGHHLKSFAHGKQSKIEKSKPRSGALTKEDPNPNDEDPAPVTRVASDFHLTMDELFYDEDEQPRTVGGLDSPAGNDGISVAEFLEQEKDECHIRPDSPTLPVEFELTIMKKDSSSDTRPKLGLQMDDDVFKIGSSFSNMREQKRDSLIYQPPALVLQKYPYDILPGLPAQLLNRDDFLASTVAAIRSVSAAASPGRPKSSLTVRSSPRRHSGTPLSLQRATSAASRTTNRFSDESYSSSSALIPKRHSVTSISDPKRHSLTSIIEVKRHSLTSIAEASKRLSIQSIAELKRHSVDSIAEVSKLLTIPSITEKRISLATDSTITTGPLTLTRSLTIKKMRSWRDLSLPAAIRSPRIFSPPPSSSAFTPRNRPVFDFNTLDEDLKQNIRKACKEGKEKVLATWLHADVDNLEINRANDLFLEQERIQKTEEEKQCEQEEATSILWNFSRDWDPQNYKLDVNGVDPETKEPIFAKRFKFMRNVDVPEYVAEPGPSPFRWAVVDNDQIPWPVFWHGQPPFPDFRGLYSLPAEADFDKPSLRTSGFVEELCPIPTEADFNKITPRTSGLVDQLCSLPTEADFNKSTPRASRPETPMSPTFVSRIPSMRTSRTETPMSPTFVSMAAGIQTSRAETPVSPPLVSRTTSLTAFPDLIPIQSIERPLSDQSFTFASRISSRRPSATGPVSAANPFGPMVSWDRPQDPPEVVKEGGNDGEAEGEQETLKYPTQMIRYYAHDEVQKALRKIYAGRVSANVTATQVAKYYLDTLDRNYTSEVKLEYSEGQETGTESFSQLSTDKNGGREFWRSLWALKFLERCEKNGW